MSFSRKLTLIVVFSISLAVSLGMASAQTSGGNGGSFVIPGGLVPDDNATGPVANVGAEYKFDDGFYQKIQDLILAEPQAGDFGVHDGERYYNVIMIVSRDDGDGRGPDETASENKDSIVRHLNTLGARDIIAAESLSFVTASIPVAGIPGISLRGEIYQMGDGELPVTVEVDRARQTIDATPSDLSQSIGMVLNGTGVIVAVVDTGIDSIYLNSKVTYRAFCDYQRCMERSSSSTERLHGTKVAQVIAASGMRSNNGMAPRVTLLDAEYNGKSLNYLAHAVDWSYSRGADVINLSLGYKHLSCSENSAVSFSMIINEAVDKGVVVVKSAGNGGSGNPPKYQSISPPGCAHNVIAVGGINDRRSDVTMYNASSRGPISDSNKRLAPHIVAPAYNIQVLNSFVRDATSPSRGTSFAAPQVSAVAAMLLQASPELTPAEVRAALLLGADWKGPIPCTSKQYERNNANDNCSYARQPADSSTANNAASLEILNNVGFGILDAAKSLKYASTSSYIISDHLDSDTAVKRYRLTVSDTSDPAKVILTWMVHPHGGIAEQLSRRGAVPVADLNLEIIRSGTLAMNASSAHQTTEFAVFNPPGAGEYEVRIRASPESNPQYQTFALASTSNLTALPPSHHPVAPDILINTRPPFASRITPEISDPDGDDTTITSVTGGDRGSLDTRRLPLIIYRPNQTGTDTVTYMVSDGNDGISRGTIYLYTSEAGNTRPVLDIIHDTGVRAGQNLNFTIAATDADSDQLTFGIANEPDGAMINAGTGYFSWTPSSSQSGSHTITFFVHDDNGGADWQNVDLYVLRPDEINRPPVPEDITTTSVVGEGRILRPVITDPDGDEVAIISVSDARLGNIVRTYLSEGTIVYVGGAYPGPEDTITYTVSDGRGGIATGTISITVVWPDNIPPILGHIHDKDINAGRALTFTATATDIDRPAQTLTFTLDDTVPAGASITPQGAFSWRPTASQVGSHSLTVVVTDGAGGRDTETFTVTVRPSGYVNRPPVAPDAVAATPQDTSVTIRPALTDPDGDRVRISQTSGATKGRILPAFLHAGIVIYQPSSGQFGTETATYTAFDGWAGTGASTDTGTITIFINKNGNASPVLGTIGSRSVTAGQTLAFTAAATDADGNAVSYTLAGAPDGATISQQGSFRWAPSSSDTGSHTFTVVAYDSLGGADTETVTVRVL